MLRKKRLAKNIDVSIFLIILSIVSLVVGCWVHWEAVVKPLKDIVPNAWDKDFPAPFYIFDAPIWIWHDLAYTLIIFGAIILAYYSIKYLMLKS